MISLIKISSEYTRFNPNQVCPASLWPKAFARILPTITITLYEHYLHAQLRLCAHKIESPLLPDCSLNDDCNFIVIFGIKSSYISKSIKEGPKFKSKREN